MLNAPWGVWRLSAAVQETCWRSRAELPKAEQVHALLAQHELPPLLQNAAEDLKGF
jgi:hypothetical protein